MIADRTVYNHDVRYTGKLTIKPVSVTAGTHDQIRFNGESLYERTQTQTTNAWQTKVHEISE